MSSSASPVSRVASAFAAAGASSEARRVAARARERRMVPARTSRAAPRLRGMPVLRGSAHCAMDVRCPSCGEINPQRAKFCLECGTSLAAVRSGGEERRTVTVVFAALVGSTALGERLDSESLRRVVDRYYDAMRAAVEAEDGTVAKFIGDAVMAVWGARVVREDDALRAVRAALAMRRELAALNEDLAPRWGVRLGVR